jgi:MFS family permease
MSPTQARALVALAGRLFLPLAWIARLPRAMGQIAVLLLVADTTGSYGAGGIAAASLAIGSAVGGPLSGVLADRMGQRVVLLVAGPAHALGLVAVTLLAWRAAPLPLLLVVCVLAGVFVPQVGPLVRVRWVALVRREGTAARRSTRLSEAFAYEGAADEATFVAGPALVGILATATTPLVAPLVAAALALTTVSWFAVHWTGRLVEPGARAAERAAAVSLDDDLVAAVPASATPASGRRWPRLPGGADTAVLLLGALALGTVFGGTQAGVTAFAGELGRPGVAGLVYAVLGLGSALAGLASAALPARFRLSRRLVAFAAALALLSLPLLFAGNLPLLCVAVGFFGCAVAPYLITVYALAERTVSIDRAASVMTLVASAIIVGYATGSSTAGLLGDEHGSRAAFAVPVGAAVLALVNAVLVRGRMARLESRRTESQPQPAPQLHPAADVR